jgi:NAD(P)-dependent dehydrogenase (short-subunit alcohol dehydrogenase family)
MNRLEGKVAVITGGNSGIGLAAAKRLQEEGVNTWIFGRSRKTLDGAMKTIGHGVVPVQGHVAKLADVDKLYAEVSQKLGNIDALFVNAGVAKFSRFAETSESTYDENLDIDINTISKERTTGCRKALPLLNDRAAITLNTRVAGQKSAAVTSAYSATKATLRSLARTTSAELAGRGIRVNAVAPGPMVTPIIEKTGLQRSHR